jgi:mannose-6-phosphate isomerase-like protein (cupin superfamily)
LIRELRDRGERPDLVDMSSASINLADAFASFDEIYSPRIVGRVNDYDVKIAHAKGEHVWHVHDDTDEFFHVVAGEFEISMRDAAGSVTTVVLRAGEIYVVPRGVEHKPSSSGADILMFEPRGTVSTGDSHEGEIPAYVDSTSGRDIG